MVLRLIRTLSHSNLTLYPKQPQVYAEKKYECGFKCHAVNHSHISKKNKLIKSDESDLTKRASIFYRQEAVFVRFSNVNMGHFSLYRKDISKGRTKSRENRLL